MEQVADRIGMLAKTIWPIAAVVLLSVFLASCKTAARKTSSGVSRLATGTIQAVGKTSGKITKETIKVGGQSVTTIGKTTAKTSRKLVTETIQTTAEVATATGKATSKALLALAKTGQVTFVEGAKGFITSIPFVSDMDLITAIAQAKLDSGYKTFDIIRPDKIIRVDWTRQSPKNALTLEDGDVIAIVPR